MEKLTSGQGRAQRYEYDRKSLLLSCAGRMMKALRNLGEIMKAISFGVVGAALAALTYGTATHEFAEPSSEFQVAATCFKSGEQTSGMNKICYYDCMGSQAAITISSLQLCPLSINR